MTVTPHGFADSPQRGLPSKAPVAAPAGDPDSASSSPDSDDISDHCEAAGGSGPPPVPEPLPRASIKVPSPKIFTGDGDDLKPQAFDRYYNSVQLYLRLHNIAKNAAEAGNCQILHTEGRALRSRISSTTIVWRKPQEGSTSNLSQGTIPHIQA